MATDNVVPIDAEAARHLAQRNKRFKGFVAALGAIWLAAVVLALLFTPLPPLAPLLALGTLVVLAEHRSVLFGDETSMSGSIVIFASSVFIFVDTSPLAGPLIVGSIGGIYLPHIRHSDIAKVTVNAAGMGLSTLAASLVVAVSPGWMSSNRVLICSLSVGVFWCVNNFVVARYLSARIEGSPDDTFGNLCLSEMSALVWAGTAGLAVASLDATEAQLVVVALAIALFVLIGSWSVYRRRSHLWQSDERSDERLLGWLVALVVLIGNGAVSAPTLAATVALLGVTPLTRMPLRFTATWVLTVSTSVALLSANPIVDFAVAGTMLSVVGILGKSPQGSGATSTVAIAAISGTWIRMGWPWEHSTHGVSTTAIASIVPLMALLAILALRIGRYFVTGNLLIVAGGFLPTYHEVRWCILALGVGGAALYNLTAALVAATAIFIVNALARRFITHST